MSLRDGIRRRVLLSLVVLYRHILQTKLGVDNYCLKNFVLFLKFRCRFNGTIIIKITRECLTEHILLNLIIMCETRRN